MPVQHLYLDGFPEKHKVEEVDVVALYHEKRFEELDKVVICKGESGNVTATFGDSDWYCLPFARNKENASNYLRFNYLDDHPKLQRELKLFAYGWLFNKNPQGRKALKFSGLSSKVSNISTVYRHLAECNYSSISNLSASSKWSELESYFVEEEYVQGTIEKSLIAVNGIIKDTAWHRVEHNLKPIESKKIAKKLNATDGQQTLTIPERLCDAIYGKAIELVEEAHPYRELIAKVENNLQENYLEGKRIVDEKVANGATFAFIQPNGR
ncbi:phage integrase [Vibrio sp. JCM 19236]|nr:phage integrase [Vibrio sp. JCM 19236]